MWNFETYLKEHKIATLDIGGCLAEQYENIDTWPVYRPLATRSEKTLFKLYEHLPPRMKQSIDGSRWYGAWKHCIENYDTVIIGNSLRGRDVIEYIQSRNPNARTIIYYTSIIGEKNRKDPRRYAGLDVEFCTFDKGDSERFGIRYLPYYYKPLSCPLAELRKENAACQPKQDVFFIGMAYDRAEKLVKMHEFFQAQGINDKQVIVKNPHQHYEEHIAKHLTDTHMTYEEIIEEIRKSRCILEIVQGGQQGISLRPMEAAVFQRKLITDNKNIVNSDLYTSDNIFILGINPIEKLKDFIESPYVPLPDESLEKYTPQYWLDKLMLLSCNNASFV